jgi:hypothetical protein
MQILGISNFYPTAPTTAPTSLSAIPTNTNVAISFTAPTNDGGLSITNYEYSFNNSSWTALSPADATSPVTISGLTQNTAYTIYLRAVNGVGSGPGSTGVSFTTEGVPTGTPTITSIPVGTTTATVNFTYPGGGGAVTGYDLYVANQTNSWNNTTSSPISVTGLTANSYYVFYVRAKNAYGVGPQSAGVGATTNPIFMSATGGSTFDYASGGFTYRSHTFTSSGTFTVSTVGSFGTVDAVIVAGGGGGGTDRGGGGGAGGMQTTSPTLAATSYGVTVGGGGGFNGGQGGNSSFNGVTSSGGGYAGFCCYANPTSGGSGGGCSANGGCVGGAGTAGQGNAGGNAPGTGWMGSGGGGKGAAGVTADGSGPAAGGTNAFRTGSNETYSYGGQGRGGAPFNDQQRYTVAAYGSGGAGGASGQNGYQGVVIIRYRIA